MRFQHLDPNSASGRPALRVLSGVGVGLLLLSIGLLVAAAVSFTLHRQVERTIAADQMVTAEIYREGRVAYRDSAGDVRLAKADVAGVSVGRGAGPDLGRVQLLVDPGNPHRLQPLGTEPIPGWTGWALAAGGVALAAAGVAALMLAARARRRPVTGPSGTWTPLTRWEANTALLLSYPTRPDQWAREHGSHPTVISREILGNWSGRPRIRPWLPPPAPGEVETGPPTGRTRLGGLWLIIPGWAAVLAGLFTYGMSYQAGPGRGWVVAGVAMAAWVPAVVAAVAVIRWPVRVEANGRLTVPSPFFPRRFDLSQLRQVTGWSWTVDRGDPKRPRPAAPRLNCTTVGVRFRDGRHLIHSPNYLRDSELVGRALRWWAWHNRASVTPDIGYGFGLVSDPRQSGKSPVPVVNGDEWFGGPRRWRQPALTLASGLLATLVGIAGIGLAVPLTDRVLGWPADPRVVTDPCGLLADTDLAGRFVPAPDQPAWQGCAAAGDRQVWLSVNPSLFAAPRMLHGWIAQGAAAAPIRDPELLSAMGVSRAHLVLLDEGARVTIVYVTDEAAGIASVTSDARRADGSRLDDAGRFQIARELVRAYTGSEVGRLPVRGHGFDAGDRARELASWELDYLAFDTAQVDDWLAGVGHPQPPAPGQAPG